MSDRDIRVCFAGDSFVAGIGDSAGLGWVGRVVAAGIARGLRLSAYNLGVRRETSVQVLKRLPAETQPRLSGVEDPRIVLSFGVNDTHVEDGAIRTAPGSTVRALREIHAGVNPIRMLFVGPPAVSDNQHNTRLGQINAALKEECVRLRIPFVDTFHRTLTDPCWQQQVTAGDGYHPDSEGYAVLATIVTEPILDWLA